MNSQELNLEKKKRGRPAIGRGEQVNTMLRPEIAAALDLSAREQDDNPTRPEMLRRILKAWLLENNFLSENKD